MVKFVISALTFGNDVLDLPVEIASASFDFGLAVAA